MPEAKGYRHPGGSGSESYWAGWGSPAERKYQYQKGWHGAFDEFGYTQFSPAGGAGPWAQFEAEKIAARRNLRLEQEAGMVLGQGLETLGSYRPGGAAQLTSPFYQQQAQTILQSRREAPDLLYQHRRDRARRERKAARRDAWVSAGISAATTLTAAAIGGGKAPTLAPTINVGGGPTGVQPATGESAGRETGPGALQGPPAPSGGLQGPPVPGGPPLGAAAGQEGPSAPGGAEAAAGGAAVGAPGEIAQPAAQVPYGGMTPSAGPVSDVGGGPGPGGGAPGGPAGGPPGPSGAAAGGAGAGAALGAEASLFGDPGFTAPAGQEFLPTGALGAIGAPLGMTGDDMIDVAIQSEPDLIGEGFNDSMFQRLNQIIQSNPVTFESIGANYA